MLDVSLIPPVTDIDSARAHGPAATAVLPRLWADVRERFPAWLFVIFAVGLTNVALTNLSPARPDFVWTSAGPLAVFLVHRYLMLTRRFDPTDALFRFARTALACLGVLALLVVFHRPDPMGTATLIRVYEYSNLAWAVLLGWHALTYSRSLGLVCFSVGFIYGLMLENGGILLGYFSEIHYELYLGPLPAPLATMIGWSMVLYMAIWVTREARARSTWLRRHPIGSASIVTAVALLLDLQIDPLASAATCWLWNPLLKNDLFLDVPVVNFVAWASAIFPFALAFYQFQRRYGLVETGPWTSDHVLRFGTWVPAILVAATAMFLILMAAVEGGYGGPAYEILYRFLGV